MFSWLEEKHEQSVGLDDYLPQPGIRSIRSLNTRIATRTSKKQWVEWATLYVQHAFLYISLPSLHDYDVNMPNFTCYGGREQATTKFSFLSELGYGS